MKPSTLPSVNTIRPSKPAATTSMKTRSFIRLSASGLALAALTLCASGASASPKDTLNAADVAFIKHAASSGKGEVKIATLAETKAERPDVKEFAAMIVADHTKVNEELNALAKKKGVELSAVIEPAHAGKFQKLEKLTGKDFDKEFLAELVGSHKKGVANFEKAAKDAVDSDVKSFAETTLPALKRHLAKAEELTAKEVSAK